jgi:hypothetical protein
MKQFKLIFIMLLICSLGFNNSYAQGCSASSSYGSCYANVSSGSFYESDAWLMTCPTGHAYYYVETYSSYNEYGTWGSAEADLWGDFPNIQCSAYQGQPHGYASNSLSGLNPSQTYNIDVSLYGNGPSSAYISCSTW